MANAWVFQDARRLALLGDKCPWSAGWYTPDGKRRSKVLGCKSLAEKHARKVEGLIASGTYGDKSRKAWSAFREEFDARIIPRLAPKTERVTAAALDHFERLAKPGKVESIRTQTIDDYVVKRLQERGRKKESKTSPATVNRELRTLKAALRIAHDWGYLRTVPKFRFVKEEQRMGAVMTPEHFELIYGAADKAKLPTAGVSCPTGDWWRALLVFALTTGWRIDEILSLRKDDLDLETGRVTTRAADNKGRRDDTDYLPASALAMVKGIIGFQPFVFPWLHDEKTLWVEFRRIQEAAGIKLPCSQADRHKCSPLCAYYGFHAIRRAYATLNCDTMSASVLQAKMRHKSFSTTQRYISLANKMKQASQSVFVPEFLRKTAAG